MLGKFKFLKKSAFNFAEVNKVPIMKTKGRVIPEKKEEVKVEPYYKPSTSHSVLLKFCADYAKLYSALHSQIYTATIKKMIEHKIKNIENLSSDYDKDEKIGFDKIDTVSSHSVKTIKEAEQLLIKTIIHDEKFKLQV